MTRVQSEMIYKVSDKRFKKNKLILCLSLKNRLFLNTPLHTYVKLFKNENE